MFYFYFFPTVVAQWVFSSQQLNLHSGISVPLIWNIKLLNFRFPFNWYGPKYRCNWKDIDTCLKPTAPWKWRLDDCQILVVILFLSKLFGVQGKCLYFKQRYSWGWSKYTFISTCWHLGSGEARNWLAAWFIGDCACFRIVLLVCYLLCSQFLVVIVDFFKE